LNIIPPLRSYRTSISNHLYDIDTKYYWNQDKGFPKNLIEPVLTNKRTNIPYQHRPKEHSTETRGPTTLETMRTPESVIARKIFNDYLGTFEINNINGEKNNCTNESLLEQTSKGEGGWGTQVKILHIS
jgi:hypothetical protein